MTDSPDPAGTTPVYRPAKPDEHEACNELIALAFGRPGSTAFSMEMTEPADFRVVEADGKLAAVLEQHRQGQWWMGAKVPSAQVNRLATAPHVGGRGYASALVTAFLGELHDDGVPTATLFASTLALYRSAGFECAGDWTEYSMRADRLPRSTAPYRARQVPLTELDEIKALYGKVAPTRHGALARDDRWWEMLIGRDRSSVVAFLLDGPDGPVAWAIVGFSTEEGWRVRMRVRDWGCLPGAEQAMYGLLGGYGPLDGVASWSGPDPDPLLFVLPERQFGHYGPDERDQWLLRIVDLPAAIAARPFPESLRGTARFKVTDLRCPWNSGTWLLEVADGRGRLEPVSSAGMWAEMRGLAALFTGFLGPEELTRAGLMGDIGHREQAFLRAAFCTHRPWTAEHY
jgi:predicted acetyltransferase